VGFESSALSSLHSLVNSQASNSQLCLLIKHFKLVYLKEYVTTEDLFFFLGTGV
jgi:hypothetical protein